MPRMRAIIWESPLNIAIFHNIMWSKYKGGVFSAIHEATKDSTAKVTFTQIAETESDRVALGGVDFAYHRYPYELIFEGNYYGASLLQRVRALVTRAWKTDADIVVLPGYERPEYWAMLFTLMVRRKLRAVFCDSTAYDRPSTLTKTIAKRFFFAHCHGFFGYGIRSREYLMMHGADARNIFFRCQAAALPPSYQPEQALSQRIESAPQAGESPRYLYVGRLSPEKGLDTLIQAFSIVKNTQTHARLVLIGAGPLKKDLEQLAEDCGVASSVDFAGSMGIEQLAEEYARATALVLPSTSEPWGLVVNEALSYGCPAIVSNICGCVPELIQEGKSGFVFQANNIQGLAEIMAGSVSAFSDADATARYCIELMKGFSPEHAAQQIIEGCRRMIAQEQ